MYVIVVPFALRRRTNHSPRAVDDFKGPNSTFKALGGKAILSEAVYRNEAMLARYHTLVRHLCNQAARAQPTLFHEMFNGFARRGHLLHLFTMNIDGLETRLPFLYTDRPLRTTPGSPPNTSEIHGNTHYQYCTKCRLVSDIRLLQFVGGRPPPCPNCEAEIELNTKERGKRASRTPGALRPWILLYGHDEEGLQASQLTKLITSVSKQKPDLFIVGGTALTNEGAMNIVEEISNAVHQRKGLVVWISNEAPKSKFIKHFDIIVKGTCDQFAELAGYTR